MTEQQQLEQAIAVQQTLRGTLPDAVVDATVAALREKLAALEQAPRDEQRKLVTVLFGDLVGWTTMSERMDAEDARAIQQAYFAAVTPPILQRGGRVEKYIGDAVLAVFGVPLGQETDPENAVRAALAMQQAMIALNHHLAESSGPNFLPRSVPALRDSRPSDPLPSDPLTSAPQTLSLRIGIHTGPVLATVGQRPDDFVVTGDTVNLAARLQAAAPPGGVLISHNTWRHVQGLVDATPQEPLMLKGKAEPVRTYLIARTRPRLFMKEARGVAGIATRMVGREVELLTLKNTLQDVMADGELRLVTVVGEGGVGKSRLLSEFEQWVNGLPESIWYFKGRASPEMERQPYGLLRDMLAARFGVAESDTRAAVQQKLEAGMRDFGMADAAHLVGQLLGYDFSDSPYVKPLLDDPKQLREQALAGLAATFAALAAQGPVLILLEDLHWADDSSLDALNHLAQALTQTPVFVLAATRPDLYERRPHWGEGWAFDSRLDLRPLSKRASRELVAEILQRAEDVPASLQDVIVAGAEGNPFFVEELIKMLVDDGVIDITGGCWRVDLDKLKQAQIPATLTGVLQARLDRLPSEERAVLQQASVVGPVFWDRAVLACSGEPATKDDLALAALRSTLHALRSREFVYHRETSVFENAVEHTFKHAILRDVTYESVLKRLRRVYHGLVADWLIEQAGERLGEFVGGIADHLERAGRSDEAASYLLQAGDQARLVQAHREAVQRYERALAIFEEKGAYEQAARACMRMGLTHQNAFEHPKARQAFDRGFALWQREEEDLQAAPLPPAPHAFRVARMEPPTLDPTLCDDVNSFWVIEHLFSGLAEPGPDFGVTPDVAQSWHVSEDGCTYVFHLRDDVHWSDGTPVTAGDFEYAWKRRLKPGAHARLAISGYDIKNARAYHRGELSDAERIGVRAVDDRSLVLELEQPAGYFLQLLANTYPVPRHVVERCGESWTKAENIVTNGPFLLKSWQPGQSIILVRNPNYHGRFKGNVTQVEANFHVDWPTNLAMYEADELDSLGLPSSSAGQYAGGPFDSGRARQRHADEYVTKLAWNCVYLGMNASKRPFDDPQVRRALVLATNRETLADTLFQGLNTPATGGFVPPEMPGHSPGIGLPYDPAQARWLLTEAGYPNGRGFPAVDAFAGEYFAPQIDFLRQQWRDNLGIEVTSVTLDFRSLLETLDNSSPAMFIMGWTADYPDPDNFLRVGLKRTRSWWQNEPFERLIKQAKRLTDQSARMELYRQADRILVQEAAIMPLVYGRDHWLRKPWVTGPGRNSSNPSKDIIIRPH